MDEAQLALVELGRQLKRHGYRFITVTPETHRRNRERAARSGSDGARNLRDVFGFSRPFAPALLPEPLWSLLQRAGCVRAVEDRYVAEVRFSSLGDDLFVHSAYPTDSTDAVFFGPDTYRYGRWLRDVVPRAGRLVDVGAGSGAGGLHVRNRVDELVLADISPKALRFSEVNAALCEAPCALVNSDVLRGVAGDLDVVISNPPYMRDGTARAYRDGGGSFGEGLSVRIVEESLARLSPGGMLALYTGATIVDGADTFWERIAPLLAGHLDRVRYEEIDPDVFGEEIDQPAYAEAERIAAVGLVVRMPG